MQGRTDFLALRRSPRRGASGPVRVQFVPASGTDGARRVAFVVPRKVAGAVERNRCRRRLRAIASEDAASVPAGAYLVGVDQRIRTVPFQELRLRMIEAMQRAASAGAR